MSDGGNPKIQSIICKAILTTPDPFDKVVKFYGEKLGADPATGRREARAEVKDADARSISSQDDSQGRPVKLRVLVVNRADTSTTLVISRAEGEVTTYITWSHHIRIDDPR